MSLASLCDSNQFCNLLQVNYPGLGRVGPTADCKTGLFNSQSEKTSLKKGILEEDQIPCCQLWHIMQQNRFSSPSAFAALLSETLHASHAQAEATQHCAAAEEHAFLSAWGYAQRHTLTCSRTPLVHNSVCQVQLVNRSQIRPTSCSQHMGSQRRGSCRATLQMCEMQVWSCLEINR